MSPDARRLWYWVTTCVDDFAFWCGPNDNAGPTYSEKITYSVWQEIKEHNKQKVFVDKEYYYKVLAGQFKRDGRGAQGNVQLRDAQYKLCMNLHVPLYRVETVYDADGFESEFKPPYKSK